MRVLSPPALLAAAFFCVSSTHAYTPSTPRQSKTPAGLKANANSAVAAAALSVLLFSTEPALASNMAAQISLNSIPPTSVEVNVRDLPIIGEVLSGTYTKVSTPVKNPSITIASPKDKIGAVKSAATNGHLEFDVKGVLGTHLDVDITADQAGVAQVRVASPLIPQLPFKSAAAKASKSGKPSDWFLVTNVGDGQSYYFNDKSGETTYQKPKGI